MSVRDGQTDEIAAAAMPSRDKNEPRLMQCHCTSSRLAHANDDRGIGYQDRASAGFNAI